MGARQHRQHRAALRCRAAFGKRSLKRGCLALALLILLPVLPAQAEVAFQEVTSPKGITAWLVEDYTVPIITMNVAATSLSVHNSFVSSVGWVKPGDTYPFRVLVKNFTNSDAAGAQVARQVGGATGVNGAPVSTSGSGATPPVGGMPPSSARTTASRPPASGSSTSSVGRRCIPTQRSLRP
mgnify:CR=1 FL=1